MLAVVVAAVGVLTPAIANLLSLLDHLGVKTEPTEMSFGISRDHGAFEWSGASPSSLFAQRRNLTSPAFWRMLFEIVRFNTFAPDLLSLSAAAGDGADEQALSLGDYLDREGYSEAFRRDYLLPIAAAMCTPAPAPGQSVLRRLPAVALVRFMCNHHLLHHTFTANPTAATAPAATERRRPTWLTIKGGAKSYVDAMVRDIPKWQIHLSTAVHRIGTRCSDGKPFLKIVEEETHDEYEYVYDHIVVATHADQALHLLGDAASARERELLSAFKTSRSRVYLHSDLDLMPALRSTWAAWNYLTTENRVSVTYNMNILQHIRPQLYGDVLATLNPPTPPKKALTRGVYDFAQPVLHTRAAMAAQTRLGEIQGRRELSFVGAWTGWGFHEDGCRSGLRAAERLGVRLPWRRGRAAVVGPGRKYGRPRMDMATALWRIAVWLLSVLIGLVEGVVEGVNDAKKRKSSSAR